MRLGPRCDVTAEGASERLADFSIFNMADMYKCILEELEKVSTKSWAEFKNCCTEIMERIGVFRWKVPHYSKFTVDFNSQQYLPSSSDCVALETSADSSCFRSFSILVSGNEDMHTELRVRCVVELALFIEFYMSDEDIFRKMFAQKKHLKYTGSHFEDIANDRSSLEAIYQEEIISTCKPSSDSGVLQLLALGSIIRRKIMSVYPETTPNVSINFLKQFLVANTK